MKKTTIKSLKKSCSSYQKEDILNSCTLKSFKFPNIHKTTKLQIRKPHNKLQPAKSQIRSKKRLHNNNKNRISANRIYSSKKNRK